MKKVMIAAMAIGTFFFASCKKEYVCECKKIHTDNSGNSVTTSDGNYTFKDTQPRAEDKCNNLESTGTDLSGSYTRECSLN